MAASILVVDDSITARTLLKQVLTRGGYTIEMAGTGPEAVEKTLRLGPSLLILDHQLPGFDGSEVARQLAADPATASIPLVLASSLSREEMTGYEDRTSIKGELRKPYLPAEVLEVVGACLRERELPAPPPVVVETLLGPGEAVRGGRVAILVQDVALADRVRQRVEEVLATPTLTLERGAFQILLASTTPMARLLLRRFRPEIILFDHDDPAFRAVVRGEVEDRAQAGLVPMSRIPPRLIQSRRTVLLPPTRVDVATCLASTLGTFSPTGVSGG